MPRRQATKAPATPAISAPHRSARVQKLRERVAKEQATRTRWLAMLKRIFRAFERHHRLVTRIERQLTQLEE
jgi:hypothetical protein